MRYFCTGFAFLLIPIALLANSTQPFVMSTGAPGEQTCLSCHNSFALNPPGGSVTVETTDYRPEIRQIVRIIVSHPEAIRWGFQMTARRANDGRQVGRFTPSDEIRVLCPPSATAGPCNNVPEYATHGVNATAGGMNGARTYEVEWTPPSTDEGDVIFYVAATATNGNGLASGDRVYATTARIRANAFCSLPNRPALTRVENGASFEPGFAPGGMVTLRGNALFQGGDFRIAAPINGVFPKELNCIAVEIDGKRAPLTFVSPDQINVQAPADVATGPVQVRVIVNPGRPNEFRSDPATVNALPVAPAFFLFYNDRTPRSIAARHADFSILGDPALIQGARPAQPGEVVLLYGSGFGKTNPNFDAGAIPPGQARLTDAVTVTIGGVILSAGDVKYAGLTPESISGLYQFNVRIPTTVADGDVPVSIRIGGVSTPSTGAVIPVRR